MADIVGTAGNDTISGSSAADTFTLLAGNDVVNSQGGADTIIGGAGFDTISYIFSPSSVVLDIGIEFGLAGFANDNRWSSIEKFGGSAFDDSFIGGDLNVEIEGLTGDDIFKGAGGRETFNGGAGIDTVSYEDSDGAVAIEHDVGTLGDAFGDSYSGIERFVGTDFGDYMRMDRGANINAGNVFEYYGGDGNDTIFSNQTGERIDGGDGNDFFYSSLGADVIIGGAGFDRLYYDGSNAAVDVFLDSTGVGGHAEGDSYEGIEFVLGSRFSDYLTGNAADNTFSGGNGADNLIGTGGNDRLIGGTGDDSLYGGADKDYLDGGNDADVMFGGLGNDFYIVDDADDQVIENTAFSAGGGIDTVRSFIDYIQPNNIELVRLGNINGTSNLNATGNDAPGTLVGNAGDNVLIGRGGNDQLNGNDGDDRITGNTGRDTMVGGAGSDTFVYASISESRSGAANRDVLNGFDRGSDLIDLSAMDADLFVAGDQAWEFIGTQRFDADGSASAGQLRLQGVGGPSAVLVEGDLRGDGVVDFQIFVNLTTVLGAEDFIL